MGPMRLYMNSCLCGSGLASKPCPRHSTFPIKNMAENMAATFARFTQLLTIEFPYRRRSMGPMRLYMLVRTRSCIKTMSATRPSLYKNIAEKMAATFARFTQLLTIEFPYRRRSMGPMRLYLEICLSICLSVTKYHQNDVAVTKFLLKTPEKIKISNQIATFDLSRPNASKIATTTEYCP